MMLRARSGQAVRLHKTKQRLLRQPRIYKVWKWLKMQRVTSIYIFTSSGINTAARVTFSLQNTKKKSRWWTEKADRKTKTKCTQIPYRYQRFYLPFKETTATYMTTELWSTVKQKEWNGLGPSTNDLTPFLSYHCHSGKSHYLKRNK